MVKNILVVYGWSVIQEGQAFRRRSPKLDGAIKALSAEPRLRLQFMRHLESFFPVTTAYRSEWFRLFRDIPMLIQSAARVVGRAGNRASGVPGVSLLWHEIRVEYWRTVLLRGDIRGIVGTNLTKEQMIAAKNLGVPSVEVMHGVLSNWYATYWSDHAPSHVACWPLTNVKILVALGIEPIFVPFPWSGRELTSSSVNQSNLLVILTWGATDSADGLGAVPLALDRGIRLALSSSGSVRLRIHPVFPRGKRAKLRSYLRRNFPGATLDQMSLSLVESLQSCSAVMMHSSTSWMESLTLGVRTIITDINDYNEAVDFSTSLGLPAQVEFWSETGLEFDFRGTGTQSTPTIPAGGWSELISVLASS